MKIDKVKNKIEREWEIFEIKLMLSKDQRFLIKSTKIRNIIINYIFHPINLQYRLKGERENIERILNRNFNNRIYLRDRIKVL